MEKILREFPHSFETERLTIRAPQPGDGPELHAAIIESLDRLRPWFPWAMSDHTVASVEANLRQAHADFMTRDDLRLSLYLKGTNTVVGSSGLHRIDWSVPKFEIGYWVRSGYEGQGYITEAVMGITDFAFSQLGARRVEIHCNASNQRSAAVAQRCAYLQEACLHNYARHHQSNKLRDELIFAQVRPDAEPATTP